MTLLAYTSNKYIRALLGLLLSLLLFFASSISLPYADERADVYFEDAITQAGLAYGATRILNASVSVIKDSSLALEPAGVGVSIAAGQVLDPVDDMAERVSDILVFAIASLGVLKLLFELSISFFAPLFATVLVLMSLFTLFDAPKVRVIQIFLLQIALILVVARVCLPFSAVANDFLSKNFFEPRIDSAKAALEFSNPSIQSLQDMQLPKEGTFGIFSNGAAFLSQKAKALSQTMIYMSDHASQIINNLLELTFLYAGLFLIQVILLPVLVFLFLLKVGKLLLR